MHRYPLLLAVIVFLVVAGPSVAQTTVTFQQGVGGYTATQDTQIRSDQISTNFGGDDTMGVDGDDGGATIQGLLRFDNIFGTGAGQIPLGSTITAATIQFRITSSTDTQVTFHRMLRTWSQATVTWDNMGPNPTGGNGIQFDGTDAVQNPDLTFNASTSGQFQTFNVLPSLQAWSGGAANLGWGMQNAGGNGWDFATSENADVTFHPLLSVTYAPIPEPGTMLLASLGMGTLGLTSYRRWRRGDCKS
jgi:hypothetical protein